MTDDGIWRSGMAHKMSVIVDADDYFRHARAAMMKAKSRIMLIGWDFDARIRLGRGEGDNAPETVGDLIYWLVEHNPKLEIYLLRWDMGALKTFVRGTTIFTLLKWMRHPRIHTKLDGHHPTGGSHHQKIVVIDDCFAFCGGIDMTGSRWDTRAHRDDDPKRRQPSGKPHGPWHDATSALEGPVAGLLGELARSRWARAGGKKIEPLSTPQHDCWPSALPVDFADVEIAISRTEPAMSDCDEVHEIETLYIAQIARAKRTIYAESQYFASRRIAEAIAARLGEDEGPEIVVINPDSAQGWLEPIAMDSARARLIEALRRVDKHRRFRMYHPVTAGGEPIYVHAKILIVDDVLLRIGSSNMNNRSLRLDTECDVTIDTAHAANGGHEVCITAIRNGLIAEHLGCAVDTVAAAIAETGSLIAAIEAMRGSGKTLVAYEDPDLSATEAWLADNEVLDPEGPDAMFEAVSKRGLFTGRLRGPR